MKLIPESGLHFDMADPDYRSVPAISQSSLKHFLRSAAHGRAAMDGNLKFGSQEALIVGRLCHTAVLEPNLMETEYSVAPKVDKRTKVGKAEWASFLESAEDRTVVTEDQHALALALQEQVLNHDGTAALLAQGSAEVSAFWQVNGINCKGRFDWLTTLDEKAVELLKLPEALVGRPCIFDLKTTQDASPKGFGKSVANFTYHMQAAFYSDGYAKVCGGEEPVFIFGAIEKEFPYGYKPYRLSSDALETGRAAYQRALAVYATAAESDQWLSYSPEVSTLQLPSWAV